MADIDLIREVNIVDAAHMADLDDACAHLQTIGEIETGDVAGVFFSGPEFSAWDAMSVAERASHLRRYVQLERLYA